MSAGTRVPFSVELDFVVAQEMVVEGKQLHIGDPFDWKNLPLSPYDLATLWKYGKIDCVPAANAKASDDDVVVPATTTVEQTADAKAEIPVVGEAPITKPSKRK